MRNGKYNTRKIPQESTISDNKKAPKYKFPGAPSPHH